MVCFTDTENLLISVILGWFLSDVICIFSGIFDRILSLSLFAGCVADLRFFWFLTLIVEFAYFSFLLLRQHNLALNISFLGCVCWVLVLGNQVQ